MANFQNIFHESLITIVTEFLTSTGFAALTATNAIEPELFDSMILNTTHNDDFVLSICVSFFTDKEKLSSLYYDRVMESLNMSMGVVSKYMSSQGRPKIDHQISSHTFGFLIKNLIGKNSQTSKTYMSSEGTLAITIVSNLEESEYKKLKEISMSKPQKIHSLG